MRQFIVLLFILISTVAARGRYYDSCEVDYTETYECPSGYRMFTRRCSDHDVNWCIKVIAKDNFTFWESERYCRCKEEATLSAIDSIEEYRYISMQADRYKVKYNLWFGAYRKESCLSKVDRNLCGPQNGWQFTSSSCNQRNGFIWNQWFKTFPVYPTKSEKNCVKLNVPSGSIVNDECGSAGNMNGFVCGKLARRVRTGSGRPAK